MAWFAAEPSTDDGPTGRINVSDNQSFDESTLTPDIVLSKIQAAYFAGLKRCYKTFLETDANAQGRVKLSLTVNETGGTEQSGATGFAADVDSCIEELMGSWRFPIPMNNDGDATSASFSITVVLVPDSPVLCVLMRP